MTTRAEFVATVRTYLGTPYHHQGRSPGIGLDCPGPLICACWHHGIKPLDFNVTGYPRQPDGVSLQAILDEHMTRIDYAEADLGDVIMVRFQQGHPQHLGILSGIYPERRYWIEAEGSKHRRVLEARLIFNRHTALVAAYRVPGLT
jgi:cell wall-associated NlpC family hydrolase